jgi:hypothetical protein
VRHRVSDAPNRCAMWDNAGSKASRPQGHTVLTHRPQGLTPLCREGLAVQPTRSPASPASDSPTSVYRYYDRYDLLIYVGITSRGISRNFEHNRHAAWWPFVARQEVDHLLTRRAAEKREQELIRRFRPPFNRQHNPGHDALRSTYLAWATAPMSAENLAPRDLYVSLGRALPLRLYSRTPNDFVFITRPDHRPLAELITFSHPHATTFNGRVSTLRRVEDHGPLALIHIKVRSLFQDPIAEAFAHLRLCSQKPLAFEVKSLSSRSTPNPEPRRDGMPDVIQGPATEWDAALHLIAASGEVEA